MNVPIYEMTWSTELGLTIRELDVLACLTEYQSSKRIAKILDISPRTAETHIFKLMQKLGKNTRTAVIDLIKNADYAEDLRQHFVRLDEEFHCQEHINLIKKETNLTRQDCHLLCSNSVLKHKIEIDLKSLNISCLPQSKAHTKNIHVKFTNNYPYTFFLVVKSILGETAAISQAIVFFKKQKIRGNKNYFPNIKITAYLFSLLFFFMVFFCIGAYDYWSREPKQIIRSDFCIPIESKILHRSFILKNIQQCFQGKSKIECVALVGIGGAGKTTLARQYAKQQNFPVIWEINAENHAVLLDSFSDLSYNLSKTQEEKNEIEFLRKNHKGQDYERKLIQITKQKLKRLKNWFLIFDNVEKLDFIKSFLPFDAKTCGSGKILITTRNNNIADNFYIRKSNTISVLPLSEKEKEDLFFKLQDTYDYDKKGICYFLKTLPPFPLDIVLANSYLKNTCGYNQKFEKIYSLDKQGQARFHMIDKVIQDLIKRYPTSVIILLFITQIGSQNIPKDLLWNFKAIRPDLNEIMTKLAEQSLISYGFDKKKMTDTFSIHRSTQENILMSLIKCFGRQYLLDQTKQFIQVCADYCLSLRMQSDIKGLHDFLYHLKILQSAKNFLNEWQMKSIQSLIGSIHVDLGCYSEALNELEDSAHYFDKIDSQGKHHETRYNLCYLVIAQKEQAKNLMAEKNLKNLITKYKENHIDSSEYYFNLTALNGCFLDWFVCLKKKDVPLFKKALINYTNIIRKYSSNDLSLITAYQEIGAFYLFLEKNYEMADFYLRKSIDLSEKVYGAKSIKSVTAKLWLSHILRHQGHYKASLEILEALQKQFLLFQKEGSLLMPQILISIGENYRKLGQIKKAKFYILEAQRSIKSLDPIHKYWHLNFISKFYITTGKISEALEILHKSLTIHESMLGKDHFKIGWVSHLLGLCYTKKGDYVKAEQFFKNSLRIYENYFGRNHHVYGLVLKDYGFLCALQGYHETGIAKIKSAEKIFKDANHPAQKKCQDYLKTISKWRVGP